MANITGSGKKFIALVFAAIFIFSANAGQTGESDEDKLLKILVQDAKTKEPLPYANILFVKQKSGTITNEAGYFSLHTSDFKGTDTISIQYIGYKNQSLTLTKLKSLRKIDLEEEFISLNEIWVYKDPPNAKDIIKKVLENKDINYKPFTAKSQLFIRERQQTKLEKCNAKVKKNTISEIEENMINDVMAKIPRNLTSYTDYLTYAYSHKNSYDSLKLAPLKIISLEGLEIMELVQFVKTIENLFRQTGEDEFWKAKSGIFGSKIDHTDSVINASDTLENKMNTKILKADLIYNYKRSIPNKKKHWDFLYKTNRYTYEFVGGAKMNVENVFIIDFKPKEGGRYEGRVYISMATYALLRADYQYGVGRDGRNIRVFGIGYHEKEFRNSISYENVNGNYRLKYLSTSHTKNFSLERPLSLIQKKKRKLINKNLKEIKLKVDIATKVEKSTEILVMSSQDITEASYLKTKPVGTMDVTYVNQFSDANWEGYTIIEPTKQMREYQKKNFDR